MHHSTILFDLDGTLTDPREGITRSVQYALAKLGIDEPDLTALEHFIGPPLLQCFMATYALDEATGWQAVNHYRERFRVTGLYENRVFDGVETLLEALLAHLLDSERLAPGSALMIGDRKHDLIGARSNGLQAVAVGYGFGSREELLGEAPDFHFETLEEMRRAFIC